MRSLMLIIFQGILEALNYRISQGIQPEKGFYVALLMMDLNDVDYIAGYIRSFKLQDFTRNTAREGLLCCFWP